MKRNWAVRAAAGVGLVLLSACSSSSGSSGTSGDNGAQNCGQATSVPSADQSKHVTLKFWMLPFLTGPTGSGKGKPTDWGNAVIKDFEKAHPNVTVDQEMLSYAGYNQKIQTALAAGSPPDVVMAVGSLGGIQQYARLHVLEPIGCFVTAADKSDFTETAKGSMEYSGMQYMWPWEDLVSGLAVNTDVFKDANAMDLLPLTRPHLDWTFDQFKQAAEKVSDPPNRYAFEVHGKDGTFYDYLWGINAGGTLVNDDFTKFTGDNDSKFADGLQFLASLPKENLAPGGAAGLSFGDAYNLFLQQKIVMFPTFGITSTLSDIKDSGKPFNVAVVGTPHAAGVEPHAWTNASGFMVFKQSDPYKRAMAMDFARTLTNTENNRIVAKAKEVFPARKSAEDAIASDKNLDPFRKLQATEDTHFPQVYGLLTTSQWDSNFQSILTGTMSPKDAVKALRDPLTQALQPR